MQRTGICRQFAIALVANGMLQILAIEHTEQIRKWHCWWMRTYSFFPENETVWEANVEGGV